MLYREAGDFKTTYAADAQTFPIAFDRYRYYAVLLFAFAVVPFLINDYWANAVLLPVLIFAIAALGLNILTGYCGQVSLGTGGFMAVGAYACYKFMTGLDIYLPGEGEDWVRYALPPINIFFSVILAGFVTALVGVLFGLPSLRIKGFYLAVATLAAQFFLVWLFNKWAWAYNYSASGQITAPTRTVFGIEVTGPIDLESWATYLFCLVFVVGLAWIARNLTRGPDRALVDGDPRHGHRRRNYWREPAAHQVIRLCGFILFHRHRRGVVFRRVPRRGGSGRGLWNSKVLPDPLHDHHRRAWLDLRLLRRGGLHDPSARRAQEPARGHLGLAA